PGLSAQKQRSRPFCGRLPCARGYRAVAEGERQPGVRGSGRFVEASLAPPVGGNHHLPDECCSASNRRRWGPAYPVTRCLQSTGTALGKPFQTHVVLVPSWWKLKGKRVNRPAGEGTGLVGERSPLATMPGRARVRAVGACAGRQGSERGHAGAAEGEATSAQTVEVHLHHGHGGLLGPAVLDPRGGGHLPLYDGPERAGGEPGRAARG